jgi:hypothetical protein
VEMPVVVCQKWLACTGSGFSIDEFEIEYGYSLHLTVLHLEKYLDFVYPECINGQPQEYPRPDGKCYFCLVDEYVFDQLRRVKDGSIRYFLDKIPEEYKD